MARDLVLIATLALIALLAALTIDTFLENGFDVLVGASLVILLLFGVGVVGALTTPPKR